MYIGTSTTPIKCREEDLLTREISDKAIQIAAYWDGKGI